MIILKHKVAERRRELQNTEALARIRERTSQNEAATQRALAWRTATKRLEQEQDQIAWEMHEEQANTQVQSIVLEREARNRLRVAKNRAKTFWAQERQKAIRLRRVLEK